MTRFDAYKKVTNNFIVEYDQLTAYFSTALLNSTPIHYKISFEEEARPDLIAKNFYGNWTMWWVIMVFNNVQDPFTELLSGTIIQIPSQDDIVSIMNSFEKLNR